MVKCHQRWTSHSISITYIFNTKVGGRFMDNEITIDDDFNVLQTLFNINLLNVFVDEKVDDYITKTNQILDLKQRVDWIRDWKADTKKTIFARIYQEIEENRNNEAKLERLNKRVERYFNYFEVLESDDDTMEKYDEFFNTLIQIPSEIFSFIKIMKPDQNGTFMKNDYKTDNNGADSSNTGDCSFFYMKN